jgi:hypothetical protein
MAALRAGGTEARRARHHHHRTRLGWLAFADMTA